MRKEMGRDAAWMIVVDQEKAAECNNGKGRAFTWGLDARLGKGRREGVEKFLFEESLSKSKSTNRAVVGVLIEGLLVHALIRHGI